MWKILTLISVLLFMPCAQAADKTWNAAGDQTSWTDNDNWFPVNEPTAADDVLIDTQNSSVICDETFTAKSITIGGREPSVLATNNFVFGTVSPDAASETAILNRTDGKITLTGAGVITLKGQYQDSESTLTSEPSFMFWVE